MGVWRNLGYVYAALNLLGGFILIGLGVAISSQPTGMFGGFYDLTILALIYGGLAGIIFGILVIWALVKSGQIESIEKNIKIIAEWTQSQKVKEGSADDDERFFEDQQRKLRPK